MAFALGAFAAPALANYRVEVGSKGSGSGEFIAEGQKVKCEKVAVKLAKEVKEEVQVTELQVIVVYSGCHIETIIGTKSATVGNAEFRIGRGKANGTGQWIIPVENKNEVKIEVPELGCKLVNKKQLKEEGIEWRNLKTSKIYQSELKAKVKGIAYKAEGCGLGGIKNGEHTNGELIEKVVIRGITHK